VSHWDQENGPGGHCLTRGSADAPIRSAIMAQSGNHKLMKLPFFLRHDTVNKRIFRAALIVGAVTVLVKVGTTVKDLSVARFFGRNDSLDAFLFAFMLPAFALTVLIGGVSATLVPVLVETRQKEGPVAGQQLLASVLLLTILALVVVALFLGLFAPVYLPYLAHNFPPGKIALTRDFLYMLIPWLILSGIATFIGYVLNSVEKFAVPALTPILTPLAILVCIAFWARPATGFSLATGTVAGSFLEVTLLLYLARKHELLGALRWHGFSSRVCAVLSQTAPMMAGGLLMGTTSVVDQSMAAMLASGSVAALSYGNKVPMGLLSIGATALSTAILPYFSRMAADSDWAGCRHTLKRYTTLMLAVSVPATALLILFSRPLVKLLFQRGAFTSVDTAIVSRVQIYYCLQIPFYVLCMLFVRFLSSVRRNDLLMFGAAINLVVDIVMNLVLMRIWGVAGIALSTSIVTFGSLCFLSISSIRLLSRQTRKALDPVPAGASR
jgi:putative peptidoglycan lipid II flippase